VNAQGKLVASRCVFASNIADNDGLAGGAVRVASFEATDCQFEGNKAGELPPPPPPTPACSRWQLEMPVTGGGVAHHGVSEDDEGRDR
jgi:hypothetical protein